jgi:hypothetical protein
MFALYLMLTHQDVHMPHPVIRPVWLNVLLAVCTVATLPVMIPLCLTIIVFVVISRKASHRIMQLADFGDVLSSVENATTFTVMSPPHDTQRLLLRQTEGHTVLLVCHDNRDAALWIPPSTAAVRVCPRIGRVELTHAIDALTLIVQRDKSYTSWYDANIAHCWSPLSVTVWKAQTLFMLQRPVRYIQRAWRARRVKRQQRAAAVIVDAVLAYLYRPGGRRFEAARGLFKNEAC